MRARKDDAAFVPMYNVVKTLHGALHEAVFESCHACCTIDDICGDGNGRSTEEMSEPCRRASGRKCFVNRWRQTLVNLAVLMTIITLGITTVVSKNRMTDLTAALALPAGFAMSATKKEGDWFQDLVVDRYYTLHSGAFGDTGGWGAPYPEFGAAIVKDLK